MPPFRSRGNAVDGLVLPVGGLICGFLAGFAAQYGRLCTVGAIEDAVVAGDFRRAGAWAISAAFAILFTQTLVFAGALDLSATHYAQSRLDLVGADQRADCCSALARPWWAPVRSACSCASGRAICAHSSAPLILGLAAFAATGGILSPIRTGLAELGALDTAAVRRQDVDRHRQRPVRQDRCLCLRAARGGRIARRSR